MSRMTFQYYDASPEEHRARALAKFDGVNDWVACLREMVHESYLYFDEVDPGGPGDVGGMISYYASEFFTKELRLKMADAALTLMAEGDFKEMAAMWGAPVEEAPDAFNRLLAVLKNRREDLIKAEQLGNAFWQLLRLKPGDSAVLEIIKAEAKRTDGDDLAGLASAAAYCPTWVAQNLCALVPAARDPDGSLLLDMLVATDKDRRHAYLNAVAACGSGFVDRLICALNGSGSDQGLRDRLRPYLDAHPAFKGKLP